jgi:hypothetical protein
LDEKTKEFNLSEKEFTNLMAFLMRVELKGSEVQAFVELMNALNRP